MMLECYLGATIAVLLLPCGAFRQLAFLSEKAIGYVLAQGVKLAVLAFIASAALPVCTDLSLPTHPSIEQGLSLALAVGFLLSLPGKAPPGRTGFWQARPCLARAAWRIPLSPIEPLQAPRPQGWRVSRERPCAASAQASRQARY